jgi:hypothetical protein
MSTTTELLLPNAVIQATALNADINDLNEGVDNFDNVYATHNGTNSNTTLILGFPTPSNSLAIGDNLQTFRARVRKNSSGGNSATVQLQVFENGSSVNVNSSTFTIDSLTGENISFTWNASVLSNLSGEDVEIAIVQTGGGNTGAGGNRRRIEVDTADWIATINQPQAVGGSRAFSVVI